MTDRDTGEVLEPTADQRELVMGYEPSATAAPGITEEQRRALLGQAIDQNALAAIWATVKQLIETSTAAPPSNLWKAKPPPAAPLRTVDILSIAREAEDEKLVETCEHADRGEEIEDLRDENGRLVDIWNDTATLEFIKGGPLPKDRREAARVRKRAKSFIWRDNRLQRAMISLFEGGKVVYRIVPQPETRDALIWEIHQALGHVGEKRTMYALSREYWWSGHTLDVRRVLAGCTLCQRVRATAPAEQGDMQTQPHDDGLFYRWGIDFAGPFPESEDGNQYVLLAIDYYSKWVEAFPVKNADGVSVVKAMRSLIARFGTPSEIVSDNGPAFKGDFEKFCEERHIHHRLITPGMPRTNGLAERAVQTIKRSLKKHVARTHHAYTWDSDGLQKILMGYRLTPQAATKFSPAQVLYAVDPAISHNFYAGRNLAIDYENIEASAEQLLIRARAAAQIERELTLYLYQAYERNAQRFKDMRSGVYLPRIYHFSPGDFVFLFAPEEHVPGGALGIRARHEILKVVEVKDSGVLVLENRAGVRFNKHKDLCAPCPVPHLDGTTHPDLQQPKSNLRCRQCGGKGQATSMLVCDQCNCGWHMGCLVPALTVVPEGAWICPDCVDMGIQLEDVIERQKLYYPQEESRPDLEMPSRKKRLDYQKIIQEWHGAVVRHRGWLARVICLRLTEPRRIRLIYEDGDQHDHTQHILKGLEKMDDTVKLPEGFPPMPHPITVLTAAEAERPAEKEINWSIARPEHLQERMQQLMPGKHDPQDIKEMWHALGHKRRHQMTPAARPKALDALITVLDFHDTKVILDPWAATNAVQEGLRDSEDVILVVNDKLGSRALQHEPLEPHLYQKVTATLGTLDAVVSIPPPLFLDATLVTALHFARSAVCLYVPSDWLNQPTAARWNLIQEHKRKGTFLQILMDGDRSHCWACFFKSKVDFLANIRVGVEPTLDTATVFD
jgi:transposase InsO family protein